MNTGSRSILALDLGLKCGWALNHFDSGVWRLNQSRRISRGMEFVLLERNLFSLAKRFSIDILVYEEVRAHKGTTAAHTYGALEGTVHKFCHIENIPYQSVPVQTIKKHATGKGNCNKESMIDRADWCFPHVTIIDDNHADALWLWDWANHEFNYEHHTNEANESSH